MDGLVVKKITSQDDLEKAFAIRVAVFVDEQGVDRSLEYEYEEESTHFLALIEDFAVGTARWRKTNEGFKLERFAVLPAYRGKGVGQQLMQAVLQDVGATQEKVYLNAQTQVVNFYAGFGFIPQGEEFEEAGIQHYAMVLGSTQGI